MRREGYYGLLLALLAFAVLYLLNKAGLLHGLGTPSSTGTTTATVSATVGGVPVGSSTTIYPIGIDPVISAIDSTRSISEHKLLGSNLF